MKSLLNDYEYSIEVEESLKEKVREDEYTEDIKVDAGERGRVAQEVDVEPPRVEFWLEPREIGG